MTCAPSKIPTLPDPREEDIPDLIKHFVEIYGERYLNHILSASAECGKLGP
jgi:DNA-binding NtrC family response regulator